MESGTISFYRSEKPFKLESGESLEEFTIAYNTYGRLNSRRDNVVWVCHALTANSDVADWWPHTVEKDKFLDPEKYFIVCANIIGSHYGTTGPLTVNPSTGEPYYLDFPAFTIRDMVNAHILLARHLGVERISVLVGSSVGGFQAIEWAVEEPDRFDRLFLIATAETATPWAIALDETQRMAIEADPSFGEKHPDAGMAGMAAARAIGLLSYRGGEGYNISQKNHYDGQSPHRACTYQRYQGEKLCKRYNVYSYYVILNAFDTHNVGRDRGGIEAALRRIKAKTVVVAITTDIIFPPSDLKRLCAEIPEAEYFEIQSSFGHDGFLVEHEQLNRILMPFMPTV